MTKNNYFQNLYDAIRNNNAYAFRYGDGRAWDNKKKKTMRTHMPRGNAYKRIEQAKWVKMAEDLKNINLLFD